MSPQPTLKAQAPTRSTDSTAFAKAESLGLGNQINQSSYLTGLSEGGLNQWLRPKRLQ